MSRGVALLTILTLSVSVTESMVEPAGTLPATSKASTARRKVKPEFTRPANITGPAPLLEAPAGSSISVLSALGERGRREDRRRNETERGQEGSSVHVELSSGGERSVRATRERHRRAPPPNGSPHRAFPVET
jgi:hypothetical protein